MLVVDETGKETSMAIDGSVDLDRPLSHAVLDAAGCFELAALAASDPQALQERLRLLGSRMPGGDRHTLEADRISLDLECVGFPEAYVAKLDGEPVAYLRLRWGHFTVQVPDHTGKTVLSAWPDGQGEFMDDERDRFLKLAREAIAIDLSIHGRP